MKIIGISGRKQSGKNTAANYIHGEVLQSLGMVEDFFINEEGQLAIKTMDASGANAYGILDVTRKDKEFTLYAEKEMWPYIKIYHFADILKEFAVNVFGLSHKQVYGSDSDKNTATDIRWEGVPCAEKNKSGNMTARELLQYFGTTIVRQIHDNAWVNSTINRIISEDSKIAIIPDIRFPNEVDIIKNNGGIVIRLTRQIEDSDHPSEIALDKNNYDWSNFDFVIDNKNISIPELCDELNKINNYWSYRCN
jgi:hypothetical protein